MRGSQLKLVEYFGYFLIVLAFSCGISIAVHPLVERQEIYHGILASVGVILVIASLKKQASSSK